MTISTSINKAIRRYQLQRYLASSNKVISLFSSIRAAAPQSPKKTALQNDSTAPKAAAFPSQMGAVTPALLNILFIMSSKKREKSCFPTLAPLRVFKPHAHKLWFLCRTRAPPSLSGCGAGSPSSGSWRSYTTTLMTYQHFTHYFPTTIKTFWACMAPNSHTTVHRGHGPDLTVSQKRPLTAANSPCKVLFSFFLHHLI